VGDPFAKMSTHHQMLVSVELCNEGNQIDGNLAVQAGLSQMDKCREKDVKG
jgi:hypothetical protein